MSGAMTDALIAAVDKSLPGCHRVCCGKERRQVASATAAAALEYAAAYIEDLSQDVGDEPLLSSTVAFILRDLGGVS